MPGKVFPVTPEERFEKIEKNQQVFQDQIIVTARMQQEAERRWQDDRELVWEGLLGLVRSQERLQEQQRITQAALDHLIAHIDRFVKGQGGNGQGTS